MATYPTPSGAHPDLAAHKTMGLQGAAETTTALADKADASHNHDSRYYTETEVDALLSGLGGGVARYSLCAHWSENATKTNVGASYVNVYTQTNAVGKEALLDTNGKTTVRLIVLWNKVGTGTQSIQITDGTDVLVSMNLVSGRNDSGDVSLPAAFTDNVTFVRPQVKSTTAADDPIFNSATLYLK